MSDILIRKAGPGDAEYVALLARVTFTETFGTLFRDPQDLLDYYEKTFSVSKLRESISKENNVFWIALVDELPVGYAKMKKYSPTAQSSGLTKESQLQKIYVLKDYLSKKIGQKLQEVLIAECRAIGSERVWLSVLVSNQRAIGFYNKHGFVAFGDQTFSIGKETFEFITMSKDLAVWSGIVTSSGYDLVSLCYII